MVGSSTTTDTVGGSVEPVGSSTAFDTTGADIEPVGGSTITDEVEKFLLLHSGTTGGAVPAIAPSNTFGGSTNGGAQIPPANAFGGVVGDRVPISVTIGFSGPTEETASISPPHHHSPQTVGLVPMLAPARGFGGGTSGRAAFPPPPPPPPPPPQGREIVAPRSLDYLSPGVYPNGSPGGRGR